MKLRFKPLLVISLCFTSVIMFGQITYTKGYIISNVNDTIFGRLEYSKSGLHDRCVFINEDSKDISYLKPSDINGFYISNDNRFRSVYCDGRKIFLKIISEGKVNLYSDDLSLFVSAKTDSVVELSGGRKEYSSGGEYYSKESSFFKVQLMRCISDTSFNKRIENLKFDNKQITDLITDINGKGKGIDSKEIPSRIFNKNYFAIECGFSFYSFEKNNIYYGYDGHVYDIRSPETNYLNSLYAGVNYKRKIFSTNSYIKAGLNLETFTNCKKEEKGILRTGLLFRDFDLPLIVDTLGKVTDTYAFKLSSVYLPVEFQEEISFNRLRPYFEMGLSARYYFKNDSYLNRRTVMDNLAVEEVRYKLIIPKYVMGINFGIGARYILDINSSLSCGLNIEILNTRRTDSSNFGNMLVSRAYISYNFR
jgi:hypothetical protein